MRAFLTIVAVTTLVAILGCNEARRISASELETRLAQTKMQSAVSWWYLGETPSDYLFSEKWPTKKETFLVNKGKFKLVGLQPFAKGENAPVNVKVNNFVFE